MPRRLNAKELLLREQLSELKLLIKTERDTERAARRAAKAVEADLLKQRGKIVRWLGQSLRYAASMAHAVERYSIADEWYWSRNTERLSVEARQQKLSEYQRAHVEALASIARYELDLALFDALHGIAVVPGHYYQTTDLVRWSHTLVCQIYRHATPAGFFK